MKEIVVVSGKGGTGKTSLMAAFASLAKNPVLLDCDVDAADLHLILSPDIIEKHIFKSGQEAIIRSNECIRCGACQPLCRFDAITRKNDAYQINKHACEGCGVCVSFCCSRAIDFHERTCGEWYRSGTRYGPMVHARLFPGAENSGKLVTVVREAARKTAGERGLDLLLSDGPPGIGCPVIASITGASMVVVVTEPTMSGEHDMKRILELARQLAVPYAVLINKWDINSENTARMETYALKSGAGMVGRIRYDRVVTEAQRAGKTVMEYNNSDIAAEIREGWEHIWDLLQKQ
ncbi:MAG: (4Fe-4S)-binding protein [Bdellovibrionales bacterium RIFOXYD1_FULL_53_11]|nr:MAG: (4Fe-4S)-binding protein [Bdellovibrionales bacterium RIFOXYD1_FULL_53_11]